MKNQKVIKDLNLREEEEIEVLVEVEQIEEELREEVEEMLREVIEIDNPGADWEPIIEEADVVSKFFINIKN
jgi:hypothetical protein